ncbi:MAG: hypothetical protein CMG67_00860 [Candidatus Marinimicrobia bacterium]|nr:hypothetical protein [Candidatus Neomarinimicrobiota bacterium]|tara:strand:- start:16336 stop:16545 length:210 start_codon:yes stop_codon:yes gene_type:complete
MTKNFETKDILLAIDALLTDKKNNEKINEISSEKPLILNSEIKEKKNKDEIPKDTEKIILEAEKYFKRN